VTRRDDNRASVIDPAATAFEVVQELVASFGAEKIRELVGLERALRAQTWLDAHPDTILTFNEVYERLPLTEPSEAPVL